MTPLQKLEAFDYEKAVLSGVAKNIGESILLVPVWTEEFCDLIIEVAEELDYAPLDVDLSPYGAAPGQESRITEWSMPLFENWKIHCERFIFPSIGRFYWADYIFKRKLYTFRRPFLVRYNENEQKTMDVHHDASLFTLNMNLSKRGDDYLGCSVHFPRQEFNTEYIDRGWAVVFPGQLTHPHYTDELTKGTRYSFVSWIGGANNAKAL